MDGAGVITFRVPAIPVAQPRQRKCPRWTEEEVSFITANYPQLGKMACAKAMGRTDAEIRYKASLLGLKLDRRSEFWREFQGRAASTKVGRKRPDQSKVMKSLHAAGKLTRTPEQNKAMGERQRKWIAKNGHPRGALGMKHTAKTLAVISEKSRRSWKMKTPKQKQDKIAKMMATRVLNGTTANNLKRGTWKAAWRDIGGKRKFYRSRWEANYARFLEWRMGQGEIVKWEHEVETFWFKGIKRGCVSYLPDFRVTMADGTIEYHEVKGWMDSRSKTKIKRMKKYHPTVKLVVIDAKAYKSVNEIGKYLIRGWE